MFDEQPQLLFLLPHEILRLFALTDFFEKYGDFSALRLRSAERQNVEPAVHGFRAVLEAQGLPRQRHFAVHLKPIIFEIRNELARRFTRSLFESGLFQESRIDFQKAVIDRLFVFVKQHFDDAKTFV